MGGKHDRSVETSGAPREGRPPSTYRDAGVDIDAAARALDRIKGHAHSTFGLSGAAAPIGHFGGVYRLDAGGERLLVASADGIGTKLKLAFLLGGSAHARVGSDLVNHCVDDILACGASPLFFLDYVAMGRLDGATLEGLVGGMAAACRENGLALIGGETAEMPGLYSDGEYDAAGFIVGVVEPEQFIDGRVVREGDLLIGLPSTGLHTNGYSLARAIVGLTGDPAGDRALLAEPLAGGSETVGDALLKPHRSYLAAVRPLLTRNLANGMAHITGGGLVDNVPRMLPDGLAASLDRSAWSVPPIFALLAERGNLQSLEAHRAFNMGIGFVAAVAPDRADEALSLLAEGAVIGSVVARESGSGARVHGLA